MYPARPLFYIHGMPICRICNLGYHEAIDLETHIDEKHHDLLPEFRKQRLAKERRDSAQRLRNLEKGENAGWSVEWATSLCLGYEKNCCVM
jgi:hypothetical protein